MKERWEDEEDEFKKDFQIPDDKRCQFIKTKGRKKGQRCRNKALFGFKYCFFHLADDEGCSNGYEK